MIQFPDDEVQVELYKTLIEKVREFVKSGALEHGEYYYANDLGLNLPAGKLLKVEFHYESVSKHENRAE